MSNKIAIHVPTWDEYLRMGITQNGITEEMWYVYKGDTCVRKNDNDYWQYCRSGYYWEIGCTIYTVDQYLQMKLKESLSKGIDAAKNLQDAVERGLEAAKENVDTTNPKQALGLSNIPMNMLSPIACAYGSVAKLNGSLSYGLSNFVGTEVILSIYLDALRRHLDAFICGEEVDEKDKVPHLGAILANVDIILCARAAGTLIDDRALIKGYRDEMNKLKPLVNSLKEFHEGKNPKHYYLRDLNEDKDD